MLLVTQPQVITISHIEIDPSDLPFNIISRLKDALFEGNRTAALSVLFFGVRENTKPIIGAICVQLANFNAPVEYEATSTWAHIREAQLKTTRTLPNVGMASAIDIGEAADIHPRNKRDVGHRLAQWALAHTYHRPIVPNGPHYAGYTLEGDAIRIHFTEVGGGLVIAGPDKRIKTCWIAGSNRKFVPAQATIDGDTLLVHTAGIPAPKAVRYAWADNPDGCNLYNAEGFPASPFRTDTW